LLNEGVISPIEYSDWEAALVPVLKSDGTVCGDYKVTVNKATSSTHSHESKKFL
jgi:hypothetical protein